MADECVPRTECELRCQKLEDEDRRQNERIKRLENSVEEIHHLTLSTESLAASVKQMLEEMTKHDGRISELEKRDGEKWRGLVKTAITVVVTAVVTAALAFLPR